ncbi:uncharacterized protein MKK02DRAFT_32192 [Dioszegia hungarica]|uniref:Uncharacterized protein n=1 Tax=Dioszegia hungarica TaxID=4972 RepID=A0AA38HAJ3_9TREE|nr:uncharacterized protein MKK02DRAFT_32192 [Dioszegia hungarica]KAI9637315.1 hypothetical protein MKK02DRAFT_32192 [Dioszegia hungarica]
MPASLSSLAPETLAFIMTFSDNNTGAFALAFARANKASRSCRYRHLAINDSYIFEVTPAERLVSAYQDDDKLITLANTVSALATPSRWSIVREMKIGSTLKMSLAVTVPKIIPPVSQYDRSLHVSPPPHMKTTRRLAEVQARGHGTSIGHLVALLDRCPELSLLSLWFDPDPGAAHCVDQLITAIDRARPQDFYWPNMDDAGSEAQCSAGPATSSRMVTLLSDWTLPPDFSKGSSNARSIFFARFNDNHIVSSWNTTLLASTALESVYHLWKIDHLDDLGLSSSLDAIEVVTTPTFRIRSLCRGGGELLHAQIRLLQVVVGQTQDREFDSADEDDQDDRTYPRTKRILFVDRGHCDENEIPCYVRGANTRSPFDQDYTFFNARKVDRRARLIGFSYHPHTIYLVIALMSTRSKRIVYSCAWSARSNQRDLRDPKPPARTVPVARTVTAGRGKPKDLP